MNELRTVSLRNVAVVGSRGTGKTSLAEALMFTTGAIPAMGSVPTGTTVSDFEPEEVHRHSSVSTSLLRCHWNSTVLTFLDTPGSLSLLGEPLTSLEAVDAAIVVLTPSGGIRSELIKIWSRLKERQLPCMLFLNVGDKGSPALDELDAACRASFDMSPLPMTLPAAEGSKLEGVLDLVEQTVTQSSSDSPKHQAGPVPSAMNQRLAEGRKRIQEAAAETNDQLLERYLSAGELCRDDVIAGLRTGVHRRMLFPLYCGSATNNVGIVPLLQAVSSLFPSPQERSQRVSAASKHSTVTAPPRDPAEEPLSALVFKTIIDPFIGRLSYCRILSGVLRADTQIFNASRKVKEKGGHLYTVVGKKHAAVPFAEAGEIVAIGKLKDAQTGDTLCDEREPVTHPWIVLPRPVLSFAIEPKTNADIDKVSLGLHKLIEEDPTLDFSRHADTKEMVLSGLGQLQIDVALEKLHRKYGADVVIHTPKIPYRETIRGSAQAQGKYKKQTGGHGQYGDCWLDVLPLGRGEGFVFENKVVGGVIPRNFIPAVEKGVIEAMQHGILAGFPVVDMRVAVYDGSYHVVDSSEMSFKIAASMAFKKAVEAAHPVLLEPMMTIEVDAPADHIGAVIGDLNARRGRILHVEARGQAELVKAIVPLAEILTYTTALNSLTGGAGSYVMELSRYDEVPREIASRVIEEHKASRQTVTAH
ncbi:Elongation factor G [Nitrospira sp. KM1]|uniref:elongation factor G n=1 Tax=Nitrospira sp. KM1 TaxID=1936990 RepID=UPI0013A73918|nr:elongation factor G [Nitrospira sp. KM1]BCA53435.1 Elongation factor G [Nitrospira sp. KM1]